MNNIRVGTKLIPSSLCPDRAFLDVWVVVDGVMITARTDVECAEVGTANLLEHAIRIANALGTVILDKSR